MALADIIYNFFGFDTILNVSTFPELISGMCKIGCGMWLTIFIIRSMFMATRLGESRFM